MPSEYMCANCCNHECGGMIYNDGDDGAFDNDYQDVGDCPEGYFFIGCNE